MSLKDSILAVGKKLQPLQVPEWDGVTVWLRPLTLGEFRSFQQQCREAGEDAARLMRCQNTYIVTSLCDEKGAPLMNETELLLAPSAGAQRVFEAAQALNGHGEQDAKN